MERNQEIIRTSLVGVVANVLLAAFKAFVGLVSGSIAILMDAVNNLTDVLSSVITIAGTKLSERPADREHPFGHGRIEYFTAIVISVIVLMAGVASMVESVRKLLTPGKPEYDLPAIIVIVAAIVVKLLLGRYVKRTGERLKSDALKASGADALFDALVTLSTLVSAAIMLIWKVNIDAVLGIFISCVILRAGYEMLLSPINELLGSHISRDFVNDLKKEVLSFEPVMGVYDIIMNNYGHNTFIGSLHVNVPDTMTAREIRRHRNRWHLCCQPRRRRRRIAAARRDSFRQQPTERNAGARILSLRGHARHHSRCDSLRRRDGRQALCR